MTDIAASDFRQPRRYVRLDTILRLRWLAVLGQLAAIFIVVQGLEFDVEVVPCLTIVGLSALLNLALQISFNPMQRLEPAYAAALLALNIVELAGLLFLTGGLENPFSFLFLAPVLISTTALPIRLTIALGLLAVACASVLVFIHLPLPWDSDDPLVLPPIYLFGVWLSIVVAIGVTSLYAFQVAEESRKLSDALAATELVLTREQHLTQLDGLAAAAAHVDRLTSGGAPRRARLSFAAYGLHALRAGALLGACGPLHTGQLALADLLTELVAQCREAQAALNAADADTLAAVLRRMAVTAESISELYRREVVPG